jgi:tetratricopeptide (TPR) repeat protein
VTPYQLPENNTMSDAPKEWTLQGFVEHFDRVHRTMLDHKFVWILGAGASLASGIPLGSELVDRWLNELHVREDGGNTPLEDWATAENLGIDGFKYEDRASFYPKVYERRFQQYPEEGYAYLEDVMADADPSPGYSILAAALAGDPPERPPRHNAVVTTNFDNLVADALAIYTDTFPFVCGHESLTPFVRVAMRRPLVCKIHRDLLLAPQNDRRSLHRLDDAWGMALRALFKHYTPLFIGYGGNDDTLMDLLEWLPPGDIKGRMIWCYYEGGEPSQRIVNVVADHQGILVPVPDFDLLMVLLGEKMGIGLLDEEIGRRADARTEQYRDRIQRLDTVGHPEVTEALAATLERSGGWWVWEQKARHETVQERREVVYRQGIQHCPDSAPLHGNFASFMTDVRGDHDEAERLYRKALELDPKLVNTTGNFAVFMTDVRGDHDEAERLFRKALELDPKQANITGNFALFLTDVRGDHDEAERLFRKALELDPKHVNHTGNYAELLLLQGRPEEATAKLREASSLNVGQKNELAAGLSLYAAILAGVTMKDHTPALEELRSLLSDGFSRTGWSFDKVLGYAQKNVAPEDHVLYCAFAAAILDQEKVPAALALLDQRSATAAVSSDGKPKRRKTTANKTARKTSNKQRSHSKKPRRKKSTRTINDAS